MIGKGIETADEGSVGVEEMMHGLMAVVAFDRFLHSAPEILNRIVVGFVGRQRNRSETDLGAGSLYGSRPKPDGAAPNHQAAARTPLVIQPAHDRTVPFVNPEESASRAPASDCDLKQPKIEKNGFERTFL